MRDTVTIFSLAKQALDCFELRETNRDDKSQAWFVKKGSPEWVQDLCRAAHDMGGDLMLPDDFRYLATINALEHIIDCEDGSDSALDEYNPEPAVYTSSLLNWLASHISRVGYVDEAINAYGAASFENDRYGGSPTIKMIAAGQVLEEQEIYNSIRQFLEERVEELEDTTDGDGEGDGDE